ncbi:hypothetical protein MCEMRE203_01062 [Candidatus Nanopelagicaceae bacterium]
MLLDICIEPRPTGPGVLVSLPSRITRTFIKLSLTLLVTKIFADHHNATLATNDFALVADLLHAWINLHAISPL